MSDPEREKLIREAFLLGFMCSREGFNAECLFDHCSDRRLAPYYQTEDEFREQLEQVEAWRELSAEAVKRLS